jgi:flavodoxin I
MLYSIAALTSAFAGPSVHMSAVSRAAAPTMAVGLLYSTTTGNTETVAGYIAAKTGIDAVDIADMDGESVAAFDGLIIGAPTWHTGADTERSGTAWDEFIYGDLESIDLSGKKVAVFGCGDGGGYADMLYSIMTLQLALASALTVAPMRSAGVVARHGAPNMAVGLIYSTTTGNTETVAGYIAAKTGLDMVDIADLDGESVAAFDGLIIGAPTWHTGADTERSGTAWDDFIYGDLETIDLSGKKVAVFGCGDGGGYADNFCDAMDELASCFSARGATLIGSVSTDSYEFEESKSVSDGKFVGLATDEDNQSDMSEDRVNAWVDQIKSEGMPL